MMALGMVALAGAVFAAATVDDPCLTTPKRAPYTWCSIGTSITWYNSHVNSMFTKGYQTRVLEQIVFTSLNNVGANAGCIAGAPSTVAEADFYTIEHGVNDWGHCTVPGTLDDYKNNSQNGTFAADYRKTIEAIRAKNANATIVLCTPRKAYGFNGYLPDTCDAQQTNGYYLKDYVDIVNAIAEYEDLPVADFYSTCGEQDELADLSIDVALHPNDAGYQKMANELVKAILDVYPDLEDLDTTSGAIEVPAGMGTYDFAEAKTVNSISVADAVTMTGAAITFDTPGTIGSTTDAGSIRIENDIAAGYAMTVNCPVTIAGGLAETEEINISGGGELIVEGERTMSGKYTTSNGHVLRIAKGATVTLKNTSGKFETVIEGKAIQNAYSGIAWDSPTTIADGGELEVKSALGTWGMGGRDGHLYIQPGGTLYTSGSGAIGLYKAIHIDGGVMTNSAASGNLLYKIHMKDGGILTGKNLQAGCNSYYSATADEDGYNGSFIRTTGDTACTVDLESITLGWSASATASAPVQLTFKVAAPLTVNSELKANANETVDTPSSFGYAKTGAGRLTLASASTSIPNAAFILGGGSVVFPATAKATFGALVMTADTTLKVEKGASLAFTDSQTATWTAGAKLVLENVPAPKSIKFGVDGLTADQLAAITYSQKDSEVFSLDSEGYLTSELIEAGDFVVEIPDPETVSAAATVCTQNEELYFENRDIRDIEAIAMTCYQKFGSLTDEREYTLDGGAPSSGDYTKSRLLLMSKTDTEMILEFHGISSYGSNNGIGNGFGLKLTQNGDDVYGKVTFFAGFTGANDCLYDTWASKAKTSWNDYNNTSATYSTRGSNLKVTFSTASTVARNIRFMSKDGASVIEEKVIPAGERTTTAPTPPEVDGYVFQKWDTDFSNVKASLIVTALYRKLCTVTFKDKDGTVLKAETVEETAGATAPDMTGKAHFIGWDTNFDVITDDLVVTALYGEVPAAVDTANATGLLGYETGDILVWTEEDGTWNDSNRNWYTTNGVASAWKSGATAIIPIAANITVEGTPQVGKIYVLGDASSVTFKGEGAATVSAGGTLAYGVDSTVNVEGTLALGDGATIQKRDRHDVNTGREGVYLTMEDQLVMPGVTLATANDIRMHVRGCWYNFNTARTISTKDVVSGKEGVYNYVYDAETDTATCQVKINLGGGQYITCVKVQFTQGTDGIYAKALYVRKAGNNGSILSYDRDFDTMSGNDTENLSQTDDNKGSYKVQIYSFFACVEDELPTDVKLIVKGNLDLGESVNVTNGVFVQTVDTGVIDNGSTTAAIALSEDAVLDLASTAAQKFANGCKISVAVKGHGYVQAEYGSNVSFEGNKEAAWELHIYGDTYASGYCSLPNPDGGKTTVFAGGVLRMGPFNGGWGANCHADDGLTILEGGTLRIQSNTATGSLMGYLLDGGVATNETTNIDNLLYKWTLKNGGELTGKGMRSGYISYYDTMSFIKVIGTEPSKVTLDEIQFGYQVPAGNKHYVGVNFNVEDVTGSDATDLLVTSPITERSGVTLVSDGYRANLGVWKTGAGTVELSSGGSSCATGVFKVEAGTVRFPASAAGAFGALLVTGDAAMEVDKNARITFDDSSAMTWTAEKTLTFSGTMGSKSVRIGASAGALTADQLSAIKFKKANGRLVDMTITDEGYLVPPSSGLRLVIR